MDLFNGSNTAPCRTTNPRNGSQKLVGRNYRCNEIPAHGVPALALFCRVMRRARGVLIFGGSVVAA